MKSLGKKIAFVAFLVGSLAIPLTVFAQTYVPPGAYSNFDNFLANHPRDAQALSRNPALANNPSWLEHHPGAKNFFATHQNVRHGMRVNASQFMADTQNLGNQWRGYPNTYGYMRSHPAVGQELYGNPALMNNPDFMRRHPDFARFMAQHPHERARFEEHWNNQHDRSWAHGNYQDIGPVHSQGWHGNHWAYGHDNHGHNNWNHGHDNHGHGNWNHGHDNNH